MRAVKSTKQKRRERLLRKVTRRLHGETIGAEDYQRAALMMDTATMTIDEFRQRYPESRGNITPEEEANISEKLTKLARGALTPDKFKELYILKPAAEGHGKA